MKTAKQIQKEIAALVAIKPRVIPHSAFGDDHHAAIDAQIEVLESGLDEGEVYDRADEEKAAEEEIWSHSVQEAAQQAVRWRAGEEKTLAKDWEDLAR